MEQQIGTFFMWLIISSLVALVGRNREIGYFWTFLLCLALSPLVGGIIALFFKKKDKEFHEVK